tara:strand:+ start:14442 stop:14876 length:435 start_codon:yes stop_codon:yes gene_type:complete
MKRNFLITFSFLFILTNCSIDNKDENAQQVALSFWYLINTSGGLAGVDDQFELDTVVWFFDEINGTVTVENNNTEETKQDGLDSGTYPFSILTDGGEDFIIIDGNELGKILINQTNFVIDQNKTSQGDLADGFIYTFQRVAQAQ